VIPSGPVATGTDCAQSVRIKIGYELIRR